MSPTSRTLAKLRKDGWPLVQVVERWNPHAHIRQDLFGFIDVLAIRGDEMLGVQSTSGDHVSHRLEKMSMLPSLGHWLASKTRRVEIHGWSKRGGVGKRKLWTCRAVEVRMMNQSNGSTMPVAFELA